jgi:hypothetical protein
MFAYYRGVSVYKKILLMASTSIVNFVKFIRNQLDESAFADFDHITITKKYRNDDDAAEEIVSAITEHIEALINVSRIVGKYPQECSCGMMIADDDDLANILTKGFLYRRDVAADVQEIEDEFCKI